MRARGFSLVEFMIAITIGLFLVAGLVYLIAETSRSRAEIERSSRQIENGRYALDRIAEDLRHAGFFSEYFSVPGPGETGFPPAAGPLPDPCANTIATLPAGMPLAIQAYDGVGTLPTGAGGVGGAGCTAAGLVAANYEPNTDILVVRRASTTSMTKAVAAGAPYSTSAMIQTNPVDYKLDVGANTATFTLTLPSANNTATVDAPVRRYLVRIYFVSSCNVPTPPSTTCDATADNGSPVPTLKMLELGPGPAFTLLPIAEGIEHLQFDFGVDSTGDGVADTITTCSAATPCTVTDWSNVVTAQIYIVARNTERSPAYSDDKIYSLGLKGYTTATNDAYRRHAYTSQVRLNNVAMRRE